MTSKVSSLLGTVVYRMPSDSVGCGVPGPFLVANEPSLDRRLAGVSRISIPQAVPVGSAVRHSRPWQPGRPSMPA